MVSRKRMLDFFCLLLAAGLVACAAGGTSARIERARAKRDLGEAYMGQKNYTSALREFLKAEEINPGDAILQNDLGLAYMAKKEYEKAVIHFRKALDIKADFSPARNNLGVAYMENEQWDKAVKCFNDVKDDLLYATPHFPLTNLGFIYRKKGEYDASISHYKKALHISPNFPKALHGLGLAYMGKGSYDKAAEALEKAAEQAPKQVPILLDLGRAYRYIHQYNKAYDTFKKAAALGRKTELGKRAEKMAEDVWKLQ